MGIDKALINIAGIPQAPRVGALLSNYRAIELGKGLTGLEHLDDPGHGPHQALSTFAQSRYLSDGSMLIVLPIDLFGIQASGINWMVRTMARVPGVVVVDGRPNYSVFAMPAPVLQARSRFCTRLADLTAGLARIEPPSHLVHQFRDADTPTDLAEKFNLVL
jgi:hypothetical protein